ncbi:MAG TPA: FAD binding domain-containing protein, partial [Candidatus Sulfotelmatobacter sp.]|nr:FAD binding domain-containing protein [Candidatus Sulfotelmatobacter sp.]
MIPASFEYVRPASLDEALGLLGGEGAKVIAGGQSLLPLMKLRLARPERLVDIGRLEGLRGTRRLADGRLAIGALTRYADLMADPAVAGYAALSDALPTIGDVQVRNRGTVGGALAHC